MYLKFRVVGQGGKIRVDPSCVVHFTITHHSSLITHHSSLIPPLHQPYRSSGKALIVQRCLSVLNIGLCVLMCLSGVVGIKNFSGTEYTNVFVALYMILFSLLLFSYELCWWKSIPPLTKALRKNFGFLFGLKGKALFIVFIAFLNFGLDTGAESGANIVKGTGIAFFVSGLLHLGIFMQYPELMVDKTFDKGSYNPDPTSRV